MLDLNKVMNGETDEKQTPFEEDECKEKKLKQETNRLNRNKNKNLLNDDSLEIVAMTFPEELSIDSEEKEQISSLPSTSSIQKKKIYKKRFEMNIFIQNKQKKITKKKILFGLFDKDEFIDHKNQKLKLTLMKRIKNTDNILHPNFWRARMLNGDNHTLKDNFLDFYKQIIEMKK